MKQQCPNCKEFEYEKGYSTRKMGCLIMVIGPIIIGGGSIYSRMSESTFGILVTGAIIIGLVVVLISFIKPDQSIRWSCNKCKFSQEHEL
jgi:hypothetical protein